MNAETIGNPITYEVALKLCREIRAEAEIHWATASARWCYACREARKDWAKTPGFTDAPGNRGCILVNARYAQALSERSDLAQ